MAKVSTGLTPSQVTRVYRLGMTGGTPGNLSTQLAQSRAMESAQAQRELTPYQASLIAKRQAAQARLASRGGMTTVATKGGGAGYGMVGTSMAQMGVGAPGGSMRQPASAYQMPANPYTAQVGGMAQSLRDPYAAQRAQLAGRVTQLGTKDYTQEMLDLANKQVGREKSQFDARLGRLGMSELGLRKDVQDDWAERYADAGTRARIQAEELKRTGLATATSAISQMSGDELSYWASQIAGLEAAGGMWMDTQRLGSQLLQGMGSGEGRQGLTPAQIKG